MKLIESTFKCDLCGRFTKAKEGVEETRAKDGQQTQICADCLRRAAAIVDIAGLPTPEPPE
jgi:hypothetical protein